MGRLDINIISKISRAPIPSLLEAKDSPGLLVRITSQRLLQGQPMRIILIQYMVTCYTWHESLMQNEWFIKQANRKLHIRVNFGLQYNTLRRPYSYTNEASIAQIILVHHLWKNLQKPVAYPI